MKYYKLKNNIDLIVIGNYPQIEKVKCDGFDPISDPNFIDNIGFKQINSTPLIPNGILNKGAFLTDYLSSPCIGFSSKMLVSSKLNDVLKKYSVHNFQSFNVRILVEDSYESFKLINPTHFSYELIDFKTSEFLLLKNIVTKERRIEIDSYESFLKHKKEIEEIGYPYQFYISKIAFKSNTNKHFVIIDCVNGGIGYYVSELLKKEIEEVKLTGVTFEAI